MYYVLLKNFPTETLKYKTSKIKLVFIAVRDSASLVDNSLFTWPIHHMYAHNSKNRFNF